MIRRNMWIKNLMKRDRIFRLISRIFTPDQARIKQFFSGGGAENLIC